MRPFKLRGYAVERLLGSGASGDVWRARATGSGAPVALKRIRISSEEQRARASAEAALLSNLDHPNLIRLHAVEHEDDALVLVLDLAEGGSLADLLSARGRLAPGEVITAVAPVAAALAYLHGEGVVHCDVSAANVLFTGAGVPLLADVGVARLVGDHGDIAATPAYVDPVVAAGGVPGSPSDVFMLGAVALHALTGEAPWPDPDPAAAIARAALGELPDVAARVVAAGAPEAMTAVLARALDVDPQRRGTAADLALDLRHSGVPVAVELHAGGLRPEPRPVGPTGPRHAAVAAARPPAARPEPAEPDPGVGAGRPAFTRPGELAEPGRQPPTRMVGPRPRPVIPRPTRRRRPSIRLTSIVSAVMLAGMILAAGLLWSGTGDKSPQDSANRVHPGPEVVTHPAVSGAPHVGSSPAAKSRPRKPPPSPPEPRTWAARLAALDAVRARAFARRDPRLLRQVYLRGPLLTADSALLARIVPVGCGLSGVRTAYSAVRATVRAQGAVLTVTARLAPSALLCGGHRRGAAPGAGPTVLRLEVVRTVAGLRIAAQRAA